MLAIFWVNCIGLFRNKLFFILCVKIILFLVVERNFLFCLILRSENKIVFIGFVRLVVRKRKC